MGIGGLGGWGGTEVIYIHNLYTTNLIDDTHRTIRVVQTKPKFY